MSGECQACGHQEHADTCRSVLVYTPTELTDGNRRAEPMVMCGCQEGVLGGRVGCVSQASPPAPDDKRCTCREPHCPSKADDGRCRAYATMSDICGACGYCLDGE